MGWRIAVVLLALLAGAPAYGQAADAARRRVLADLNSLAQWCAQHKLLRSRNRTYEAILHFAPDHEKARYWLRYVKRKGKWVRPRPYREPRDMRKQHVAEYERRRREILERFAERVWPLIEEAAPLERSRLLADILAVDPEYPRAREANGEVKRHGRWILRETALARKRRTLLQRLAGRALDANRKPESETPTAAERRLGLGWTCGLRGECWRIVSTAPPAEVRRALHAMDAAADFVGLALPDELRPMSRDRIRVFGYGYYQLTSQAEGMRFVDAHPNFDAAGRREARNFGGTLVPRTHCYVSWSPDEAARVDGASRRAVHVALYHRYGYFEQGWITEGFGLYLNWYLVGTRLTTYVERSEYARDKGDYRKKIELWSRMQRRDTDWLELARELRAAHGPPDLPFLASKGLNQMTVEDLVHSYSLAAYMIEGRPEEVSQFLAMSLGHTLDEALADAYDLSVPELATRLERWLEETR